MNVVNRLTLRYLLRNKRRTVVTVIGAVLSVTMLGAVSFGASSFVNALQHKTIASVGNWHVKFTNIAGNDAEKLKANRDVKAVMLCENVGFSKLEQSQNKYKPYLFLQNLNDEAFQNLPIRLKKGRLPKNENEVVISEHIETNGGVAFQIGDTIPLALGIRETTEGELIGAQGFNNSQLLSVSENGTVQERLNGSRQKTVTVVGICERSNLESRTAPGYTIFSKLDENKRNPYGNITVYALLKNAKSAHDWGKEIAKEYGLSSAAYNDTLLRYSGVIENKSLLVMMISVLTIVVILIIASSVSLIYNAFAISASERSRALGMLASVGATGKQKRQSVLFEGFLIAAFSIPFGLLFAAVGMGITFACVNPLFQKIYQVSFPVTLHVNWWAILLTILLTLFTVWLSVRRPAKTVSKISPIEAIRQNNEQKIKSKEIKTTKLSQKLFGFEGTLALKNIKRNRKRYKTTVFSIAMSLILFISVSSIMLYVQKSVDISSGMADYAIHVTKETDLNISDSMVQTEQDMARIKKIEGITEAAVYWNFNIHASVPKSQAGRYFTEQEKGEKSKRVFLFYGMEKAELNHYLAEENISYEAFQNAGTYPVVLFNQGNWKTDSGRWISDQKLSVRTGDSIRLNSKNLSLTIAHMGEKTPLGLQSNSRPPNYVTFLTSKEKLLELASKLQKQYLKCDAYINGINPERIETEIDDMMLSDIYCFGQYRHTQRAEQEKTLYSVFLYGFICLISLISAANVFNTVSTGVALRKRELAMLRSIGMSSKQFHHMICYESFFYGMKGILYGVPISLAISIIAYLMFGFGVDFPFTLPWGAIAAAILVVLMFTGFTMLYASGKIKKDNIIDVLRQENI